MNPNTPRRYTDENIDDLSSDIKEVIEEKESQESVENAVNKLFDRALDVISTQEDPVAFVDQLQFSVLESLDGNDLDDIDTTEELTHLQYLSELNDNFRTLKFLAICKKLNITQTGENGDSELGNSIVDQLFVNNITVTSPNNYFTQNARLLQALSNLIPSLEIYFPSEVGGSAPFVGLVDAYLNNGVRFPENLFKNITHLKIQKNDLLTRVSKAWSFINPPTDKTYQIVDGEKTYSLDYTKMNNLMGHLNNTPHSGAFTITGELDNPTFKIGENTIDINRAPQSLRIRFADLLNQEFTLPENLDESLCYQIQDLYRQCIEGSKNPAYITNKLKPHHMQQYVRFLSNVYGVRMSYNSETKKITASGPFYTPKFEFMRQTDRRDFINETAYHTVDSISFHPGDISPSRRGAFGVNILQRSGVNSDSVYGDLATFSQLAHRGQYQPRYMVNVPFSTKPLVHVQRQAFRKYAQDQLGYDPARRTIRIDEPVMVRATSGTIEVQQEDGMAALAMNTTATQLYQRLNLINVDLTESNFNVETGIVRADRFEFVKIDTFKSFLESRTTALSASADSQVISFINGLSTEVATEEIRDDLLEEVAEALYSYLENINKLGDFSRVDVTEEHYAELLSKFNASLATAPVVDAPTEEVETPETPRFDVERWKTSNGYNTLIKTTEQGYIYYDESQTKYVYASYTSGQQAPETSVDNISQVPAAQKAAINELSPGGNHDIEIESNKLTFNDNYEYDFASHTLTVKGTLGRRKPKWEAMQRQFTEAGLLTPRLMNVRIESPYSRKLYEILEDLKSTPIRTVTVDMKQSRGGAITSIKLTKAIAQRLQTLSNIQRINFTQPTRDRITSADSQRGSAMSFTVDNSKLTFTATPASPAQRVEVAPTSSSEQSYNLSAEAPLIIQPGTQKLTLIGNGGLSMNSINAIKDCNTLQTVVLDSSAVLTPKTKTRLKRALPDSSVTHLQIKCPGLNVNDVANALLLNRKNSVAIGIERGETSEVTLFGQKINQVFVDSLAGSDYQKYVVRGNVEGTLNLNYQVEVRSISALTNIKAARMIVNASVLRSSRLSAAHLRTLITNLNATSGAELYFPERTRRMPPGISADYDERESSVRGYKKVVKLNGGTGNVWPAES